MSKLGVGFDVENATALYDFFDGVKVGVANRVLKRMLNRLALRGSRKAKDFLKPKRSGQLRKSLGTRFRKYQGGTLFAYIVAPRKGYATRDRYGNRIDPRYYAHLVEKGRKAVQPKKAKVMSDGRLVYGLRARAVGAEPFMEPARKDIRSVSGRMLKAELKDGLQMIEAQYQRRGKSIHLTR